VLGRYEVLQSCGGLFIVLLPDYAASAAAAWIKRSNRIAMVTVPKLAKM